jgi:methylmalonyl-CoA mutase C-terminal domain/subunit
MSDVLIVAGGIIPDEDIITLQKIGIKAIFGPGTPTSKIAEFIRSEVATRKN